MDEISLSDRVREGVVGAGSISIRGILPHLAQDDIKDRVCMTVVCDPVPGRAEAAASIPSAHVEYEDLSDSENVDAVTLASPIGIHYIQGKMAIERGIHIRTFSEVPLSVPVSCFFPK